MLKQLLNKNEIKQEGIALSMKTSQQAVSSWCTGRSTPSIEMLPKLAKILNCTIEELVMAIIETKQNNSEKRAV